MRSRAMICVLNPSADLDAGAQVLDQVSTPYLSHDIDLIEDGGRFRLPIGML